MDGVHKSLLAAILTLTVFCDIAYLLASQAPVPGKTHLHHALLCVEWDVKPCLCLVHCGDRLLTFLCVLRYFYRNVR